MATATAQAATVAAQAVAPGRAAATVAEVAVATATVRAATVAGGVAPRTTHGSQLGAARRAALRKTSGGPQWTGSP